MNIEGNVITDFYLNNDEEAEILKSFLSDNEQLLFPYYENWFASNSEDINYRHSKEYILERTVTISKEHIIYWYPDEGRSIYWYSPSNINELINIIERNYYDYVCIVLENGKHIKDYKYILSIEENYKNSDDDSCRALLIQEKNKDSFENEVAPKIDRKIKENY